MYLHSHASPNPQWNTVAERVKLNDVGQANGEVEIWFNGKSVINLTGIVLCISEECSLRGLQCQTFFGGKTSSLIPTSHPY